MKKNAAVPSLLLGIVLILIGLSVRVYAQVEVPEDITWTDRVKTTATYPSPGSGSTLARTAATTNPIAWDADAVSNRWITGNGWVEFRFGNPGKRVRAGLASGNPDQTWTNFDIGVAALSSQDIFGRYQYAFFVNGTQDPSAGTFDQNTIFRIERYQTTLQIYVYQAGESLPSQPKYISGVVSKGILRVDTSFLENNAILTGCRYYIPLEVRDVMWDATVGTTPDYSANTFAGTGLKSTVSGAWNGAISSRAIVGDGYFQFSFGQTNKGIAAGLSATNPDTLISSIQYGIEAISGTTAQARLFDPVNRNILTLSYNASDLFRIERIRNKILYYKNGALLGVSSGPVSAGPLFVDVASNEVASISGCQICGLSLTEKVYWVSGTTGNLSVDYSSGRSQLRKTYGAPSGWDNDAVSAKQIPGDGFVRFEFGQSDKSAYIGLGGVAQNLGGSGLLFSIRALPNGTVQVYEQGAAVGAARPAVVGDFFLIRRGNGKVQYIQNGIVFLEHATSVSQGLYVHGAIADLNAQVISCEYSGVPEDVVWFRRSGAQPDYPFPGMGSRLQKSATTTAWDSDAISAQVIPGDGFLEFSVGQTNKDIIVGLATDNPNHTNDSINYSIKIKAAAPSATVDVREGSSNLGLNFSYTTSDVFRIERKGSTVTYLQNGAPFHTSNISSSGPLIADNCFYQPNGLIHNCKIYSVPADSDGDGIGDWWEYRYFGSLSDTQQGNGNADLDAYSNREEYEQGLDPWDYYNGVLPTIGIVSGNNQIGAQGDFVPLPLVVDVRDTASGLLLSEAPVTFSISSGTGLLAASNTAGVQLVSSLDRTTDAQTGLAAVYVKQSTGFGTKTFVTVSGGGSNSATFMVKTDPAVALWRFNDPDGSTTVADSSRGGNVGTLQGGAALTAASGFDGSKGLVLLNGTGGHVTVPHNSNSLNFGSNPFTIAGWFKLASGASLSSDSNCYGILSKGSTTGPGFDVAVRGGNTYKGFWVRMATGSTTVELTPSVDRRALLSDGKWHHFVVVREVSQALSLYLDGTLAGTASAVSNVDNTLGLRIGVTAANAYFNGTLDQISLAVDALSAADVTARWNQESNVDSDLDGMLDRWEAEQFGSLTMATATSDFDLDGLNDVDEFRAGLDPKTPQQLTKIAGDSQKGPANSLLPNRIQAKVSTASVAASGAPVTFSIAKGAGSLSVDGVQWSSSVSLSTDQNGTAQVYWRLGLYGSSDNQVSAQFGNTQSVQFSARSNDLVGRWRFEETSGTTGADSSGVGNDGVLGNLTRVSPSVDGTKAVQFDGGQNAKYFQVSNADNRLIPGASNQPFTLAMWVKIKPDGTVRPNLYTLATNETYLSSGFRFGVDHELSFPTQYYPGDPDKPRFAFWSGQSGGSLLLLPQTSLKTDVWYHVIVVYTGTAGSMYINGQLAAYASGVIVGNVNPVNIGYAIGGTRDFNGFIDDVRIYSSAVDAATALAIYNTDEDNDGWPDWWENTHFGNLDRDPTTDSEPDGMADWWEYYYFGNLSRTGSGDFDGDGISDLNEYVQGRNPTKQGEVSDAGGAATQLMIYAPN